MASNPRFKYIASYATKDQAKLAQTKKAATLVKNGVADKYNLGIEWDSFEKKWVLWLGLR